MKRKLNKRAVVLLVCLSVLVTVSVGVTLAYLFTATDPVENTFTPAQVSCDVVETFQENVKENVQIQNTGNTDAYIRAAIVVTWKKDADEVYADAPVEGVDYSIDLVHENGWVMGKDGFYYYTKAVAPCNHTEGQTHDGCMTEVLINSCSPVSGKPPEGYSLSVEIVASAIQAAPDHVVKDEWENEKVTVVAKNGTLTVTNKEAAA